MDSKDGGDISQYEELIKYLDDQLLSRRDCVTRRPCDVAHPISIVHGRIYIAKWIQYRF